MPTVKRMIESIKDNVRYIFAIDGRFEDYDGMDVSSPDVVEYLKSIPNVKYHAAPPIKEPDKRQIYLNMAEEYDTDWLLILDADDYITHETDWGQVEAEIDTKRFSKSTICSITIAIEGQEGQYPRMWYKPEGFEYTKCHNFWRRKEDNTIWKSADGAPAIKSMFAKSNDSLKTEENLKNTYEYQVKLKEYEGPLKAKYRAKAVNYSGVVHKRFTLYDA